MRSITPPFLVMPPAGVRIRTRLRVDAADEQVLRAVGGYLSRLAGVDLAYAAGWATATIGAPPASGP